MKSKIFIFLTLFVSIWFYSCSDDTDKSIAGMSNMSSIGKKFMEYLMSTPNWQTEWKILEEFGTVKPNLTYLAFGGGLELHYVLPVVSNKELKAIVIYPFDEGTHTLKTPLVVDNENVNANFIARGVLRSPVRGDWEKAGIKIEEESYSSEYWKNKSLSTRSVAAGQYTTFYWITCSNYLDEYGQHVCNGINKEGLLSICQNLIRDMFLPADIYLDDQRITLIMRPPHGGRSDVAESFYLALKDRLRQQYCYIDYFLWWDPDSSINADPDTYSWDISEISNSSGDFGGSKEEPELPEDFPLVDSTDLLLNDYIACIYEKVVAGSSVFNSYLQRFVGENSIAHLKFEFSEDLGPTVNGKFDYSMDKYWLTIKLNEVRLMNSTPLMVIKTLMHEVIHANIFAKLMSLKPELKSTLTPKEMSKLYKALDEQNFPTLYYFYEKYVYDATAQHQYMATYNVDVIASVLQEVDPTASKELCHAIAWEGLKYTKTIKDGDDITVVTEAWKNLPSAEKRKMEKAFEEYLKTAKLECED